MTTKAIAVPTLDQLVERMKDEILANMQAGHIAPSVASFGELHDYCDANCLGGLCEDKIADALIEHYGGRDQHEGMPQGMLDLINAAQAQVDQWLKQRSAELGDLTTPDLTAMKVAEFDLCDVVGDYDDATKIEEGVWLEANASYRHRSNGEYGVADFVVNLAVGYDDIPTRMAEVITHARRGGFSYLVVHAGA